jgi:alkyl sulfatase BDS1-like metallo-beta-lactamase superfamily hydrolase
VCNSTGEKAKMKKLGNILMVAVVLNAPAVIPGDFTAALAQTSAQSRDAEPATRAANEAFVKSLPFSDRADFGDAKRGFIATLPDGVIAGIGGKPSTPSPTPDFEIVEPKKASLEQGSFFRHCERSEAIHGAAKKVWIASSQVLFAMTMREPAVSC